VLGNGNGHDHVDSGMAMPESRETVLRPASGGGLRMVIDASKLDSFVQLAITKRS